MRHWGEFHQVSVDRLMQVFPPWDQAERCMRRHVHEVVSHTNPIFLSSSGEKDTEQWLPDTTWKTPGCVSRLGPKSVAPTVATTPTSAEGARATELMRSDDVFTIRHEAKSQEMCCTWSVHDSVAESIKLSSRGQRQATRSGFLVAETIAQQIRVPVGWMDADTRAT